MRTSGQCETTFVATTAQRAIQGQREFVHASFIQRNQGLTCTNNVYTLLLAVHLTANPRQPYPRSGKTMHNASSRISNARTPLLCNSTGITATSTTSPFTKSRRKKQNR